ncbi:hypothetical protein Esti_002544 [Eimeria stiedai]
MAKRRRPEAEASGGEETAPQAAAARPERQTSSSSSSSSSKRVVDASLIRNKARRAAAREKQRQQRKLEKRARRRERQRRERRGGNLTPKPIPRTIEAMRRPDDSIVSENDVEAAEAEEADEFAAVFRGEKQPKLFITTSKRPSARFYDFLKEMLLILPGAFYYKVRLPLKSHAAHFESQQHQQQKQQQCFRAECLHGTSKVKRLQTSVKTVCAAAIAGGFSAVLLFKEKMGKPHGLYICHVPGAAAAVIAAAAAAVAGVDAAAAAVVAAAAAGSGLARTAGAAAGALTNVVLAQDLPGGASSSTHTPELLLNNFTTSLGRRVARLIGSLFPITPQFTGRRLITFHNQRDFIFFRHHRYIFRPKKRLRPPLDLSGDQQQQQQQQQRQQEEEGEASEEEGGGGRLQPIDPKIGTALQEIGPRFTMKLMWLHAGVFNTKEGLYEFVWRPDLKVDRKRMLI